MSSLLLLIFCLILGMGITRYARPPAELAQSLNWWVLNIALPAMVLQLVPHLHIEASLWFLPAAMAVMFMASWGLFHWLGNRLHWTRHRIGGVVLTGGLSNSAFVGFPLIEALRGKQALSYAALADQLGSFFALIIGGSIVTAVYSGGRADHRLIIGKILRFPPFLSLVLGFIIGFTPGLPPLVEDVLTRLGATLAPLALFSVGLQLRLQLNRHSIAPLSLGLGWKLGLAPLVTLTLGYVLHVQTAVAGVALLQTAMAPMVSAAILADQYDFDPPVANMMTGIGVMLSFITVPLWNLVW